MRVRDCGVKLGDSPANLIKSTKVLMATRAPPGYHTPEQVSNLEPPDFGLCVLATTLLGGVWGHPSEDVGERLGEEACLEGVGVDNKVGSLAKLSDALWFGQLYGLC